MLLKCSYFCSLAFIASSFFSPTLRSIFLILGLFLWILDRLSSGNLTFNVQRLEFNSVDWFFIAYIAVNLVLILVHGDSILVWLKSLFTTYLQWFWFRSLLASKLLKVPDQISLSIVMTASVLSLVIVLQLLGLVPHPHAAYGVLHQPFTSSGLLLLSLFVTFAYKETASAVKLPFSVLLVLQVAAILALGQLSVWIGLLLGLLVYFIFGKKLTLKTFIALAMILLVSLFVTTLLSPRVAKKLQRLSSIERIIKSKSMQDRLHLWKQNYSAWQRQPIIGINKVIPYENLTHVHNIYLQQLVEGGLIKFMVWLSFYVAIGVYFIKNWKYGSLPFLVAYLAISVEGLLENWWGDGEVLSLFLIMVILARSAKIVKYA